MATLCQRSLLGMAAAAEGTQDDFRGKKAGGLRGARTVLSYVSSELTPIRV